MDDGLMMLVRQTVGDGRFRLERVLDEGGMGAVFLGVDVTTGRAVAVKLLLPDLGEEPSYLARFQREADVTARLSHPHVVEVIATGGGAGEPPFIAMELLKGGSINERLKNGEAFGVKRTVQIARQVLSALSAGHAIGVVHRDLKPANVMLVDGPSGQIAKIVDYGVARLAMTDAMNRLTATGRVVGTPSYMAPEQAMGVPVDGRCDVYAVGAIMHRLLVGEPPYGHGRYADILSRMVAGVRDRVHERAPGPGGVADIIERALESEAESRFQSADEMEHALAAMDPTAKTTVLDWRPPVDLATLRLAPAPEDGGRPAELATEPAVVEKRAPVAPVASASPASPAAAHTDCRKAIAWVLAAFALGIGGTWLVFRTALDSPIETAATSIPSTSIATTEADTVSDPAAVDPVHLAGPPPAPEEAPQAEESLDDSSERRTAHVRRRRVEVRHNGGHYGGGPQFRRGVVAALVGLDMTPCWPRGRALPERNRGTAFQLTLDAQGRVQSAVPRRTHHPQFERCLAERLTRVSFPAPPSENAPLVLSFGLYTAR